MRFFVHSEEDVQTVAKRYDDSAALALAAVSSAEDDVTN